MPPTWCSSDDVLDRIDEIVPPGTNFTWADAGWTPPSIASAWSGAPGTEGTSSMMDADDQPVADLTGSPWSPAGFASRPACRSSSPRWRPTGCGVTRTSPMSPPASCSVRWVTADALIGAMLLRSGSRGGSSAGWFLASGGADAADLLGGIANHSKMSREQRLRGLGGAAVGIGADFGAAGLGAARARSRQSTSDRLAATVWAMAPTTRGFPGRGRRRDPAPTRPVRRRTTWPVLNAEVDPAARHGDVDLHDRRAGGATDRGPGTRFGRCRHRRTR